MYPMVRMGRQTDELVKACVISRKGETQLLLIGKEIIIFLSLQRCPYLDKYTRLKKLDNT